MVAVRAGHEYVGRTRGSGIMSSADDVLGMSVELVKCKMCMCLARGGEVGEWMRGLGLGLTNPMETMGVLDCVSMFGLQWYG